MQRVDKSSLLCLDLLLHHHLLQQLRLNIDRASIARRGSALTNTIRILYVFTVGLARVM